MPDALSRPLTSEAPGSTDSPGRPDHNRTRPYLNSEFAQTPDVMTNEVTHLVFRHFDSALLSIRVTTLKDGITENKDLVRYDPNRIMVVEASWLPTSPIDSTRHSGRRSAKDCSSSPLCLYPPWGRSRIGERIQQGLRLT